MIPYNYSFYIGIIIDYKLLLATNKNHLRAIEYYEQFEYCLPNLLNRTVLNIVLNEKKWVLLKCGSQIFQIDQCLRIGIKNCIGLRRFWAK